MASSSSASAPSWKHDVFLSFRGEDTRLNFTDYLYNRLKNRGIKTFIDDQLRIGDQISPALLQAIEDSRFSIVIFSQNYASSSWCLDELTKIVECVRKGEHTAFYVFYEVNPSHVRHQRGSYAEAFKKHEEAHKNKMEKVVKWRQALTTASGYSGWDTRDKYQSKVITEIVSKILNKLPAKPSSSKMIGMESRMEDMLSLLHIGSNDVRMVGIWGMAGIGKTALADAVSNKICAQFERSCFLRNVRQKSNENLRMELLSLTLPEEKLLIRNFHMGSDSIREALHSEQVLIVLDDVDHIEQLEELVGQCDWFGQGSRIIITTRDMHLLKKHGVDAVYEATELRKEEALLLFRLHAFKNKLPMQDFEELCDRSYNYTKGNPLAIRILGSHLYKRCKEMWECELDRLKKHPNEKLQAVLRISFDGLDDHEKNIFLDIACFLKEEDKDYASEILKCFDFYPEIGIPTLVERALITISSDNRLCMHDLIQEMGWEIVRQESIKFPGQRSRLWLIKDVEDMLVKNSGTETIEGIVLDLSTSDELLNFNAGVFTKMIKLRWLEIRIFEKWLYDFGQRKSSAPHKMQLRGDLNFQSEDLGYLMWEGFPLKSLPSNFYPRKLFELNMRFSQLEQLCEGKKSFESLVYMDLSYSQDLIRTPDLSKAPKLRKIYLENCTSLVEIHSSIETLKNLSFLNLRYCSRLEKVAESFSKLTSLESVDFSDCSNLRILPKDFRISSPYLVLSGCSKLEELPETITELTSLVSLNLSCCSKLVELPESIGGLKSLKTLNLTGCSKLGKLPESIGELTSLETLSLNGCSELKKLPHKVEKLVADGSSRYGLSWEGSNLISSSLRQRLWQPSLTSLNLRDCNLLEVGGISSSYCLLEYLDLSGNSFTSLPSLTPLTNLLEFRLEGCKSLRALMELPLRIQTIWASNCESLETFSHPYARLKSRELKFDFSNCGRLLENEESLKAILHGIWIFPRCDKYRSFGAVVPGRSVPKWFTHRSERNSIIVNLPPVFDDFEGPGLGFCAVLGQNYSDHLWFGYDALISDKTFSKCVTHLKFSFPQEVKEFGIRLLRMPGDGFTGPLDVIEHIEASIFSPSTTLIFDEKCCWKRTITAEHPKYIYPDQTKQLDKVPLLTLRIEVEGYNFLFPSPSWRHHSHKTQINRSFRIGAARKRTNY